MSSRRRFVFVGAVLGFYLLHSAAIAATLISAASGNINATATWSVVDATSLVNSEAANTALTTSYAGTSSFQPGVITVQGIAVKLASLGGTTGTLSCRLFNATGSVSIDSVTVNLADLVSSAATSTDEGGWIVFKFGSTHLLVTATSYEVQCEVSAGASAVNLYSTSSTAWSQMLITTATQSNGPGSGDDFLVYGQLTGAGTHNAYTVTVNTTSNVSYGSVSNTLVAPTIAVGQYGTLAFGTAASTAYKMEFAGPEVTYNGGTFTVGTSGSPIPSTGSATLTLNSTTEGDTGINTRNGGTFDSNGSSGGRSVVKTKLTATATASSTSTLTTADSTGWQSGDSIYIAATPVFNGTYMGDAGTLTSNASGTSVPLTAAVTYTHTATALSYTSAYTGIAYAMNMYADVVLLNRNVIIQGSGATTNGYLYFQSNSNTAMSWVEFSEISGTAAGQRGIEADTGPNGTFSLTNFSVINSQDTTMVLAPNNANFGGTQSSYLLIQHGAFYNDASNNNPSGGGNLYGLWLDTATANPFWKIDDVAFISVETAYYGFAVNLNPVNGQFSNISISGSSFAGEAALAIAGTYGGASAQIGGDVGNTFGPITTYGNRSQYVLGCGYGFTGTVSGFYTWHDARFGWGCSSGAVTIDPFYSISDGFGIYNSAGGTNLTVRNGVIGWDYSNPTGQAPVVQDSTNISTYYFDNMELCPVGSLGGVTFYQCATSGAYANDLISLMHDLTSGGGYIPASARVFLRNTSMLNNSGTAFPTLGGEEGFFNNAFVVQDCAACSPVPHAAWVHSGFLSYDSQISHTSGYSERMTPRVNTFSGYIAGTTLTLTSGTPPTSLADNLTSNGVGFISGTYITGGSGTSYTVSQSQTVGSFGSPVQFQDYYIQRMQSAPIGMGLKVAVKSGNTAAISCWLRPSINTDSAPPWGGSAVTYNGDAPRMIVRQNPYMGVQADTVLATSSLTAGTWGQVSGTTPTAPADGEFEIVFDADQTFTSNPGGSVNVTECSVSGGAINPNGGQQFWFNGAPFDTAVPSSGGCVNPGSQNGYPGGTNTGC